jgi:hypothetical protein
MTIDRTGEQSAAQSPLPGEIQHLAAVFEAMATDPRAPAPGENSYLHLPPYPPLHRMRTLTDQNAVARPRSAHRERDEAGADETQPDRTGRRTPPHPSSGLTAFL